MDELGKASQSPSSDPGPGPPSVLSQLPCVALLLLGAGEPWNGANGFCLWGDQWDAGVRE